MKDRYAVFFQNEPPRSLRFCPSFAKEGSSRVSGKGGGFSNSTDIRMTDIAFLLGNSPGGLYRFDAEGVKKTKMREVRRAERQRRYARRLGGCSMPTEPR